MSGTRGPLPKPAALKHLEGNPGKRALNLADGVNPRIEVPPAPKHLSKEAAKEWKRITPHLEELGLISAIDRAALALYCQAYGRLAELEEAFKGKVAKIQADEGVDYAEAVYRASRTQTPSGYEQQSVIVQLIGSHRLQVHRHLMHFGLSPAARARVQPSNYLQPELPGMEQAPAKPTGFAAFAGATLQ